MMNDQTLNGVNGAYFKLQRLPADTNNLQCDHTDVIAFDQGNSAEHALYLAMNEADTNFILGQDCQVPARYKVNVHDAWNDAMGESDDEYQYCEAHALEQLNAFMGETDA